MIPIAFSVLLAAGLLGSASAATKSDEPTQPVTTLDRTIPSGELALLLKPLNKDELLIEARGWRAIVKAKAEEITHAEIAVRRENKEIDKAEEVKAKIQAAKEKLEKIADKIEQAKSTGCPD